MRLEYPGASFNYLLVLHKIWHSTRYHTSKRLHAWLYEDIATITSVCILDVSVILLRVELILLITISCLIATMRLK